MDKTLEAISERIENYRQSRNNAIANRDVNVGDGVADRVYWQAIVW
ncbi:unnamed protein product, partial [marine sediment metagenome]